MRGLSSQKNNTSKLACTSACAVVQRVALRRSSGRGFQSDCAGQEREGIMATYNLDQTAFTNTLINANFDAATRQDILNYLNTQGIYGPSDPLTAVVQYQPGS